MGWEMRPSASTFAISFTFAAWLLGVAPAMGQQAEANGFELRGKVINAATLEPLKGALVQMNVPEGKAQFSGSDGTFVFSNLTRGRYFVTARKPGFFDERELGRWNARINSLMDVPSAGEVVLKLAPEGVIHGEVKNENGEPIEGVTVRAQRWQVENGRRQLRSLGNTLTDDEGNFRIAELRPGSYQLLFLPGSDRGWVTYMKLSRKKEAEQGYGSQFYPGVADAESATAIEIRVGTQVHITQALSQQRLFEIAGVVHGANPETRFMLALANAAGDTVQNTVRIDAKSGEFQIPGVPAGTYILSAITQGLSERGPDERDLGSHNLQNREPLIARMPIHLKSDLTGVVLTLGHGISVEVHVHDEVPPDGSNTVRQVTVQLASKEFPQYSPGTTAPPPKSEQKAVARIEDIQPGTYTAEAFTNPPGYVASLRCGTVDLLRDDLTVALGAALPPIAVTVRNDGAELDVAVMKNGQPAAAAVVIYSEEYPRRSLLIPATSDRGAFSLGNLAPGRYQVVAAEDAQELEFRNPSAMEEYLKHASEVILEPGGKTSVRVEMQEPSGQQR